MPKLNDQSSAISTAIPPNKAWLGSVEKTKKEKAIPQQPSATKPENTRLCGPGTEGESNGRFVRTVFAAEPTLVFCAVVAPRLTFVGCGREAPPSTVTVPFLRFLAFGITLTRLPAHLRFLVLLLPDVPQTRDQK